MMYQSDEVAVLLYTREGIIFTDYPGIFSDELNDRVLDYYKIYAKRHPLLRKGYCMHRRGAFGNDGADIHEASYRKPMCIGPSHETGDYNYEPDPRYSTEEADLIQEKEDAYRSFIKEISKKIAFEFDALPQDKRLYVLNGAWGLVRKELDAAKSEGAFKGLEDITSMLEAEDISISDAAQIGCEEIASWLEKAHKQAQTYNYFDPDAFDESGKKHILRGLRGCDLVCNRSRRNQLISLIGSHRVTKAEMKPQRPAYLHLDEDLPDVGF